ncbi:hypothetical protein ASZ90_006527 [hydrocarbon metagenome]|uniref:Uncharacterized protein n=1 Tax=hydrocarbon metagenome TaxID=938273 RepID=A0A0W8FS47_9ZZZZ
MQPDTSPSPDPSHQGRGNLEDEIIKSKISHADYRACPGIRRGSLPGFEAEFEMTLL